MKLTIELDQEEDGRWIADVPELNILLYGDSKEDAIRKAQEAAKEIIADRIAHGELPAEAAQAEFAVAAFASPPCHTQPRATLL
jgi:predicted RNase H-like HicB family nuclease